MADYAIGDVQGCYGPLLRLLDHIQFDEKKDRLWFVGDLVNRGPQSLEVLRFIKNLPLAPRITLGNHDLFLLTKIFTQKAWLQEDDTLGAVLQADDREDLGHWLRAQNILYHDSALNVVLCHAGIAPLWDLEEAKAHAKELELALQGENFRLFLSEMYGNEPHCWSEGLKGMARLRLITNFFTRMRLCDAKACLSFDKSETDEPSPSPLFPWFSHPKRKKIQADIVFGHWAALEGISPFPDIYALDTGCVWGGTLSALRLQDRQRFAVKGEERFSIGMICSLSPRGRGLGRGGPDKPRN